MFFFDDSNAKRRKRAGIKPAINRAAIPPAKPYGTLTPAEVRQMSGTMLFDVESYINYFLIGFLHEETNKAIHFETYDDVLIDRDTLGFICHRFLLVGFNSGPYDLPMVGAALDGLPDWKLKELSDKIILEDERGFDVRMLRFNHIDLIDVAPIEASLKAYAGRLHCPRMQDLPFEPDAVLTHEQRIITRDYNFNDLANTGLLWKELKPQIELRENFGKDYGQDFRSKSDAQVAEAVILGELAKLGVKAPKPTVEPWRSFRFQAPPGLAFRSEPLQHALGVVLAAPFVIGANGSVDTPQVIADLPLRIGEGVYRMGNGGLHSSEKSATHFADEEYMLIDRDVASYYPMIMLNQNLYPEHLGPAFIEVYRSIVDRRLRAKLLASTANDPDAIKRYKTEADGLKIAVNGGIGKLSNQYSRLYAPEMNSQVTVSGQLYLLMLIEALEESGIQVVSANTDGIVLKVRRSDYQYACQIIKWWEQVTGFTTEETRYRSLHCRDVNNYLAIKEDGKVKVKGIYSEYGSALNSVLSKNPESLIVADSLKEFLANGTRVEDTIQACRDIRRFVNVRAVKGGGQKDGVYLGKTVRWYYATDTVGTINYIMSGNAVPKSEGAKPCMDLPDGIPADLDYGHYITEAYEALHDVGFYKRPKERMLL